MSEERVERRLAAIFAADVVGYSRLMGQDEAGTLARLRTHRRELVDPKIAEHKGRIVKTTGDGILIEFPSVVEAVACAVAVQRGMAERNAGMPEGQRIIFRVGVNLGDIIVENDDIHGDGVNVAARLEGLAEPGGICISRMVRDQIRDKLAYPFEDLGEQSLKNISRPVRAYGFSAAAVASTPLAAATAQPATARRSVSPYRILIMTSVVAVIGIGVAWWWAWLPGKLPAVSMPAPAATPSPTAPAANATKMTPRLSIVVLPFQNLSSDPEQEYFVDGLTEDLTTDLSQISGLFVIARNTAFTYKGKPVDARQIGRDLGVRYALEGSVRRSRDEVRVNAQLIDAETGAHLWAERFDRQAADLFKLQNEIVGRIAATLGTRLVISEAARSTGNPDVQDYILHARAASFKPISRDNFREAASLYEGALALDPLSAEAMARLASNLTSRVFDFMSDSPAEDIQRADELASRALALSPRSTWAHWARGQVLRAQRRCEDAITEYQAVIAIDRNAQSAYNHLGWCKLQIAGDVDEAITLVEQALRLSPRDPTVPLLYFRLGTLDLFRSRTDDAIVWLEKAKVANPAVSYVRGTLAAAYALKGMKERAATELTEAQKLSDIYLSLARVKKVQPYNSLKVQELAEPTLFAGLRLAGMPEE